jgi:hypothetical protein
MQRKAMISALHMMYLSTKKSSSNFSICGVIWFFALMTNNYTLEAFQVVLAPTTTMAGPLVQNTLK